MGDEPADLGNGALGSYLAERARCRQVLATVLSLAPSKGAWRGLFTRVLFCVLQLLHLHISMCGHDRSRYDAASSQPWRLERPLGRQRSEARAFKAVHQLQTPICRLRMAAERAVLFKPFLGAAEAQSSGRQRVSKAGDEDGSITVFGRKYFASNVGCS